MNEKDCRAAKYLPFDSLKGWKEELRQKEKKKKKQPFPILSDEQKDQMDVTLFECYSQNKAILISYYENGTFVSYSGVIENIDVLNGQIILLPKKKFFMDRIAAVSVK